MRVANIVANRINWLDHPCNSPISQIRIILSGYRKSNVTRNKKELIFHVNWNKTQYNFNLSEISSFSLSINFTMPPRAVGISHSLWCAVDGFELIECVHSHHQLKEFWVYCDSANERHSNLWNRNQHAREANVNFPQTSQKRWWSWTKFKIDAYNPILIVTWAILCFWFYCRLLI